MVKVVTFFLIGMMILAIMGRLRFPKFGSRNGKGRIRDARKCPECGSYILHDGDCGCGAKK
jgi:hypothetical protein